MKGEFNSLVFIFAVLKVKPFLIWLIRFVFYLAEKGDIWAMKVGEYMPLSFNWDVIGYKSRTEESMLHSPLIKFMSWPTDDKESQFKNIKIVCKKDFDF